MQKHKNELRKMGIREGRSGERKERMMMKR
jgi:hypothetical protein